MAYDDSEPLDPAAASDGTAMAGAADDAFRSSTEGAGAAASSTKGDDPDGSADGSPGGTKDRFRAALERKRGQQHAANGAAHNDSKVHGASARAGGKRSFRRKSG